MLRPLANRLIRSAIPDQVGYATEAISHAKAVLGILATDGVVLAAEKKVTGKLLDQEGGYGSGEIFLLNSDQLDLETRDEYIPYDYSTTDPCDEAASEN
ncbi:hypothetical protein V8E52_010256 [Russula decolorans]